LTDLEELQANIEHTDFDKKKSKRKKDGVFYTPEYITRYIVDNTLGRLCHEKKEELQISGEILTPSNTKKLKKAEQTHKQNILTYREWLTNLKILDPACGSGAFLNQALEFLIKEHTLVRDMLLPFEDLTLGYEIEKEILEHNLYGVDINEDAVEIAKLSLWLRTAHKGRELTSLAEKIVCANSLLNMPFDEGSFDVVIGNPPYVRHEMIKEFKPELAKKYKVYAGTADIFVYFYELGYKMLNPNGFKGFICSNKFFTANYGKELRSFILNNMSIKAIADFNGVKIFEDATVDSAITIFKKQIPSKNHQFKVVDSKLENYSLMNQSDLLNYKFSFSNPKELNILQKIESVGTKLKEWNINIYRGIQTGNNDVFIIDELLKNKFIDEDKKSADVIKPILQGKDISRYSYEHKNKYLLYITDETNIEDYKPIYEYLKSNKYLLDTKVEVKQGKMLWYVLYRPAKKHIAEFEKEKIVIKAIGKNLAFSIAEKGIYISAPSSFMTSTYNKYIIAILSSNLIKYFIYKNSDKTGAGDIMLNVQSFEQIPIPQKTEEEQQPFIKLVDEILEAKQKIKEYKVLLDVAVKTDNFDREIKLKKEIKSLENRTKECEKTIDAMVYKLYDLTDDEIKIVEGV
jgi:type II restriction/modification system DNA methylase subunit YeeA